MSSTTVVLAIAIIIILFLYNRMKTYRDVNRYSTNLELFNQGLRGLQKLNNLAKINADTDSWSYHQDEELARLEVNLRHYKDTCNDLARLGNNFLLTRHNQLIDSFDIVEDGMGALVYINALGIKEYGYFKIESLDLLTYNNLLEQHIKLIKEL